jgi:peptidoglycan/xylan/chitin deacetylase (PgdA/CDA1 family)
MDNYTFVFPILEEYGVQGSFFIPGKTFSTHQLLDVNKIHYILASADIFELLEDIKKEMDYYRGTEFDYASTDELFSEYAIANRFDNKETIFVKRMLQTVLPEKVRNMISSNLFEKYVGVSEEKLAYELYMTEDQIRTLKRHGMFIGFHGYDHYWLGNLSPEEMRKDVDKALDTLDEFIDRKCWGANYPYGNYNPDVLQYLKSQGACLGLTTEVRVADLDTDSAMELPRLDCNDFPPKSENYVKY